VLHISSSCLYASVLKAISTEWMFGTNATFR
jgi:hypothetical protein